MIRLVLLIASVAAPVSGDEAPAAPIPAIVIGLNTEVGIVCPELALAFVRDQIEGIDAVDLGTGAVRWRSRAVSQALVATPQRLIARAAFGHVLGLCSLDILHDGRVINECGPLPLPKELPTEPWDVRSVRLEGYRLRNQMVIRWWGTPGLRLGTGMVQPPQLDLHEESGAWLFTGDSQDYPQRTLPADEVPAITIWHDHVVMGARILTIHRERCHAIPNGRETPQALEAHEGDRLLWSLPVKSDVHWNPRP